MFQEGLGYKRIHQLLKMKLYTVRDYGRRYKNGDYGFGFNSPLIPEEKELVKLVRFAVANTSKSIESICHSLNIPYEKPVLKSLHDKEDTERSRFILESNECRSDSPEFDHGREVGMGFGPELPSQRDLKGLQEGSCGWRLYTRIIKKKRIAAVEELIAQGYSISNACKIAGVARSKYYRSKQLTKKEYSDCLLLELIELIQTKKHIDFTYGIFRVTATVNDILLNSCDTQHKELILNGSNKINHKRIQRLMASNGLNAKIKRATMPKDYYIAQKEHERLGKAKNILNRDFFTAENPMERLVTDVTYLPCTDVKFIYLSPLMDLYNQEIISFKISYSNSSNMVEGMLKHLEKDKLKGAMIHSDQGSVYTANSWVSLCDGLGVTRSMSRRGNCWDNSVMEGFFSRLKSDLRLTKREKKVIYDSKTLIAIVKDYIYWYNNERIQKRLNYLSPVQYRELNVKGVVC